MSLEAIDIVSGYGPIEILHGVSIYAKESRITSIIGPNGAGKSTLLSTIYGFLKPKRGKVLFNGEDITGTKPYTLLKKGISYVFQRRSVFPSLTVQENLEMGAWTIKKDQEQVKERIQEIFSMFPILEKRKSIKAAVLSGGEQRMLELARSLMLRPKIILLDEPSLGLAPIVAKQIFEKIEDINSEGVTIIMVEQNVRKAISMADYVFALQLGRNRFERPGGVLLNDDELKKLYLGG